MEIVSGRTGKPHVTSQQFRQLIEGTVGQESCILTSGENLEPELASNNSLKIRSGMLAHHGNISSVKIGTYDEVGLSNGSQGMKRIDLVVCRYTKNAETEVENCDWVVIMGTPAASNPVAPAYTVGNLQDGDLVDDCPIFEVHYDGINVTEVKKLVPVVSNLTELNSKTIKAFGASESDYIHFTAPFDCYAIIGFSCLGWGYDGEFLEFKIQSSESLPEIFAHTGGFSGNNSVYIPLLAKNCFSGLKKGKHIVFPVRIFTVHLEVIWNIKWSAICIPA